MKNLSDFKKRLKVGVNIHTTFHCKHNGRDASGKLIIQDEDRGVREVSKVQSNSFALKTQQTEKVVNSWCAYPKASDAKIIDNNTIEIYEDDFRLPSEERTNENKIKVLTYRFV